jgi:hypothetical protein
MFFLKYFHVHLNAGTPKGRLERPPQMSPRLRSLRINSDKHLIPSPRIIRRSSSGHVSDSELT